LLAPPPSLLDQFDVVSSFLFLPGQFAKHLSSAERCLQVVVRPLSLFGSLDVTKDWVCFWSHPSFLLPVQSFGPLAVLRKVGYRLPTPSLVAICGAMRHPPPHPLLPFRVQTLSLMSHKLLSCGACFFDPHLIRRLVLAHLLLLSPLFALFPRPKTLRAGLPFGDALKTIPHIPPQRAAYFPLPPPYRYFHSAD